MSGVRAQSRASLLNRRKAIVNLENFLKLDTGGGG